MKTMTLPFAFLITTAVSCSSTKEVSSPKGDDVYISQTTPSPEPSNSGSTYNQSQNNAIDNQSDQTRSDNTLQNPDNSASEQYTSPNGTTYITNNYYNGAGYDSGSGWYTAQLNQWYGPYVGLGFYSPFYYSPGFSISLGFGFGIGYGYAGWYNPWYSPYYYYPGYGYTGWYYPYYPYYGCGYPGYGYGSGGYYDGYYGYGSYGYYGYHGSSASNSSNDLNNGRHYKLDNGADVSTTESGINRGGLSGNPGTLTNLQNENTAGTIKQGSVKNVKANSATGTNHNREWNNSKGIEQVVPDNNIRNNQDMQSPLNNGNQLSPSRDNSAPRQIQSDNHPRNFTAAAKQRTNAGFLAGSTQNFSAVQQQRVNSNATHQSSVGSYSSPNVAHSTNNYSARIIQRQSAPAMVQHYSSNQQHSAFSLGRATNGYSHAAVPSTHSYSGSHSFSSPSSSLHLGGGGGGSYSGGHLSGGYSGSSRR